MNLLLFEKKQVFKISFEARLNAEKRADRTDDLNTWVQWIGAPSSPGLKGVAITVESRGRECRGRVLASVSMTSGYYLPSLLLNRRALITAGRCMCASPTGERISKRPYYPAFLPHLAPLSLPASPFSDWWHRAANIRVIQWLKRHMTIVLIFLLKDEIFFQYKHYCYGPGNMWQGLQILQIVNNFL